MQFNQPYFGTGLNNGAPFFPLNTSFAAQCVQSPEVVGEGEVVSLVLPDGSVQLFFLPTNKWCAPFITIPNKSSCWFVKSVANPIPHPTYFQNQFPGVVPSPRLTLGYSGSFEVPNPFKFHSDGATSTTDIHYFYPRLNKCYNATKLCTGVQVVVPGQSTSCQSEGVSCIPSNCGQHNCNCCNRTCENKGNRKISSQGDTKNHYEKDVICKCCVEPKIKRSSHTQVCMSIDESRVQNKRKKEKKHHSQPKKKRSTHSQTSMSIDESSAEIKTSRSKNRKRDLRKTNECRKVKSKRRPSGKCSCTSIRKRKGQKKNHTRKNKKNNRTSNTDFVRCMCSDTSLSSSKSHFTGEQYFDSRSSFTHSNNVNSELTCKLCESCLSNLELKMNSTKKNKSSGEDTPICCSSSEFSSFASQTDTSHGMLVDQEIQGNRKNPPKSDVKKKNNKKRAIRNSMIKDQEIKDRENSNKKRDKTSVTCVCIYPASDEFLVRNTPPEDNKPLDKNIANCCSKSFNLLEKIVRHNKLSNTEPIYKANADFCECFSNLIQPPTRDKTFKEIEKNLKRLEKASSSKIKSKKEQPIVSCKCSETLHSVNIGAQENDVLEKNQKHQIMNIDREHADSRPEVDFNTSKAVQFRETGKQLCGTFEEVCCCETPEPNTSDIVYSAYFSRSGIVDSNSLFHYDRNTPVHYRASRILDITKHSPYIAKSNSV